MRTAATLQDRYTQVKERMAAAAERAGRPPNDVLLVAVTKYADADQVRDLLQLGHRDLGESRVQQLVQRAAMVEEWLNRRKTLPSLTAERDAILGVPAPGAGAPEDAARIRWHMIGRLQRNKAKKAIEHARLIHGVDSMRLAEELQSVALRLDRVTEALLQVNCSGEAAKAGVALPAARHVAEQIDTMVHVRLRGVMTMAPYSDDPEDSRATFERCREIFEEIKAADVGEGRFNILSMGMSNDFEVAIECGANVVRVGSAIFGERAGERDHDEEPDHVGGDSDE